jgi:epsilon-lactone hydrolase
VKVPTISRYLILALLAVVTAAMHPGWSIADTQGTSASTQREQPPLPDTISDQAKAILQPLLVAQSTPGMELSIEQKRAFADEYQDKMSKIQLMRYEVSIEHGEIAGIPVRILTPKASADPGGQKVLLNVHGGGFMVDSGSLSENIPVAALTGIKVISVLYRMAPEAPFPAAVLDTLAVYKELLKSYLADNIVLYGTSAGAILSAETIVALRDAKLPLPAAMGFFSASADFTRPGDSEQFFPMPNGEEIKDLLAPYTRDTALDDPRLSPLFSDLAGFPPTLLITGTRDQFLSQTAIFHRALLAANVDADLIVFEAMPHAHWSYLPIPESDEAFALMARFFKKHLGIT